MSDDESDFCLKTELSVDYTPLEDHERDTTTSMQLLPKKSQIRYQKVYSDFKKWLTSTHRNKIDEDAMLGYFTDKAKSMKCSSLWSIYSMLKSTLRLNDNVDVTKFPKLILYVKKQNYGYKPKKSKILEKEHVLRFLTTAPNEKYLMHKVALIMGVWGACRQSELAHMMIDDIEDKDPILVVRIPETETSVHRTFIVMNDGSLDLLSLYHRYIALRPANIGTRRLFLRYHDGKCVSQVVGKNIFSKMPRRIAEFLQLPDCSSYTGHCFRKTSATLIAHSDAEKITLKRHSAIVAEACVDQSVNNNIRILPKVLNLDDAHLIVKSASVASPTVSSTAAQHSPTGLTKTTAVTLGNTTLNSLGSAPAAAADCTHLSTVPPGSIILQNCNNITIYGSRNAIPTEEVMIKEEPFEVGPTPKYTNQFEIQMLQSKLKQRDGEVQQLQWELNRREHERSLLNSEISSLLNNVEELENKTKHYDALSTKNSELQREYDSLCQLYAEKVEENEELKLDLQDVKEMYKSQIDELLQQQKQNLQST